MPYEWTTPSTGNIADTSPDIPKAELHLWPYRSLPRRGFVWFIGITAVMISLPLIGLVGSPLLWALLPFPVAAVAGIWWAIERSYRDGAIREELRLWPDKISLIRYAPRQPVQTWEANPHWVQLGLRQDGPVTDYVTLKGAGREVEIGAFLSVEERKALYTELADRLRRIR
jgi:uncharacterized membrane protein